MKYNIDVQVLNFDYNNRDGNAEVGIRVSYTVGTTTKSNESAIEFKNGVLQIEDFLYDNLGVHWEIIPNEFSKEMTAALSVVESWKKYLND